MLQWGMQPPPPPPTPPPPPDEDDPVELDEVEELDDVLVGPDAPAPEAPVPP